MCGGCVNVGGTVTKYEGEGYCALALCMRKWLCGVVIVSVDSVVAPFIVGTIALFGLASLCQSVSQSL